MVIQCLSFVGQISFLAVGWGGISKQDPNFFHVAQRRMKFERGDPLRWIRDEWSTNGPKLKNMFKKAYYRHASEDIFSSQNMFVDESSELEKINLTPSSPNVGHMLAMHARPHSRKYQLPLRSIRDRRSL